MSKGLLLDARVHGFPSENKPPPGMYPMTKLVVSFNFRGCRRQLLNGQCAFLHL